MAEYKFMFSDTDVQRTEGMNGISNLKGYSNQYMGVLTHAEQ